MIPLKDISAFYFEWPWALALLLTIPLWWTLYLQHKRKQIQQTALQFSYAAMAAQLKHQPSAWKRLFVPVTTSLLIACLIFGLARPTVVAKVPVNTVDMMIVLDISLSMMAEDIHPDRINAAKEAAIQFVESLPRDARVGLEVFAGDNYVLSPPTSRHDEIVAYLRALQRDDLKPRTEIGSALHTALHILETGTTTDTNPIGSTTSSATNNKPEPQPSTGSKKPDRVIVLLSDGDSHEGYPWDQAARDALQAKIMVHTIGIGSPEGSIINYRGMELPVTFSESTLRQIATIAGGSYFRVFKEADFRRVYNQIHDRTIHYEERDVDLAFMMAGMGLLLLISTLVFSLLI
jgi:Ca-activated chloride channel family protein